MNILKDPHIIIRMQKEIEESDLINPAYLIVCDNMNHVMTFGSFEEAKEYQYENSISGRVVKIPMY